MREDIKGSLATVGALTGRADATKGQRRDRGVEEAVVE